MPVGFHSEPDGDLRQDQKGLQAPQHHPSDQHSPRSQVETVELSLPSTARGDRLHLQVLELFNEEGQAILNERLDFLQSLAKFIGKDFAVPVLLNEPGGGWHWNYVENVIRVDPIDLLTQSLEYQKFVTAHEGAHRRITDFTLIPQSLIEQPGYSFMSNAIEDPRINNFLIATYERLAKCADAVYGEEQRKREAAEEVAMEHLGYTPNFVLAGLEYISQWYKELSGTNNGLNTDLPPEVVECVEKTLDGARESWEHYPSREELEQREAVSKLYQQASHDINREKVWPEFKKLVEQDLQNQQIQELLNELEQELFRDDHHEYDFSDKPIKRKVEEKFEEEDAESLKEQVREKEWGKPIPLDELSDETKEKLQEIWEELDAAKQAELQGEAEKSIREFEGALAEALDQIQGEDPNQGYSFSYEDLFGMPMPGMPPLRQDSNPQDTPPSQVDPTEYSEEVVRAQEKDKRRYDQVRKQTHKESQKLEQELRKIFRDRKRNKEENNYRSGREIDISKRIKEVAKDIHPIKSQAWERKEQPLERDYAISIVIDQTSSMMGDRIEEATKALLMLTEPLQKLGIKFEILGFNSRLNVYKEYKERFDDRTRQRLAGVEKEASEDHSGNTDDGWALHMASKRLDEMQAKRKFIIVVTDGQSNPSSKHAHPFYHIDEVLSRIELGTNQEVIGVGIGANTSVDRHYTNGITDVQAADLTRELSRILQEIIQNDGR